MNSGIWKVLLFIAFSQLTHAEKTEYPFDELSDCTDSQWEEGKDYWEDLAQQKGIENWFKATGPVNDDAVRAKALKAASGWASSNGYLPCSFEMCGMVTETSSDSLMVYITSVESYFIAPEVMVAMKSNTFKVHDSGRWHSGCAHRRAADNENS